MKSQKNLRLKTYQATGFSMKRLAAVTATASAMTLVFALSCGSEVSNGDDDDDSSGGAGGSKSNQGGSATGGSATGGYTPVGKQPPGPPSGAGSGDGAGVVLAFKKVFMGGTEWDGTSSPNAWKQYGYDLDGLISTKSSSNLCQPAVGAPSSTPYPDGNEGIDNSYGKNILPTFLSLIPTFEDDLNSAIAQGDKTFLIEIEQMGTQANYQDLLGKWYVGRDFAGTPQFTGSDSWPIGPEALSNPSDIDSSSIQFATSYVNDHTWVSQPTVNFTIAFPGDDFNLAGIPLRNVTISMELEPDLSGATHGIIAGIIDTESYINELQKVVGNFALNLCDSAAFQSLADQIRQASDIMIDGSQDPSKTCNGISFGMGFEATAAALGSIAPSLPPVTDPCP
jgi:hypothetical protein